MSLRMAVLGLLAQRPMTGFELIREFDVTRSVIWPAPQNEVYRMLAGLEEEALVSIKSTGARGARTYAITAAGRALVAAWLKSESDYSLRYEPMLKAVFLSALSPRERRERAKADYEFFADQLGKLKAIAKEKGENPRADARRMAIGFYTAMADWSRKLSED